MVDLEEAINDELVEVEEAAEVGTTGDGSHVEQEGVDGFDGEVDVLGGWWCGVMARRRQGVVPAG